MHISRKTEIILDIDNTIVDTAYFIHALLKEYGYECIPPVHWYDYDEPINCAGGAAMDIIEEAVYVTNRKGKPFEGTKETIDILRRDYIITFVSFRKRQHWDDTKRWLEKNDIYYDHLHLTEYGSKKAYITENTLCIVDDAPSVIKELKDIVIIRDRAWNRKIKGAPRITTIPELLDIVLER